VVTDGMISHHGKRGNLDASPGLQTESGRAGTVIAQWNSLVNTSIRRTLCRSGPGGTPHWIRT